MPVFLRRDITDQFPGLKKENLKNSDYAVKSIQELFSKVVIEKSKQKTFNYCKSIVAVNDGNGHFTLQELPVMVQLSSVNAVCATDINKDGKPDLIIGGNLFEFPPQFGRLDASYGHILLNDGKGNFTGTQPSYSGMSLKGAVKDIRLIKTKQADVILVAQNNQKPVVYRVKR